MEPGYGVHTPSHTAHGSATFGTGRAARFSCAFCVRRFVPESLQNRKQKLETWHDNWIIVLTQVISTVGRNTRSSPQIACIWVIAAKLDIKHVDESTHFCCHFPVVADAGDTAIGGVACFQCSVCDDSATTLKKNLHQTRRAEHEEWRRFLCLVRIPQSGACYPVSWPVTWPGREVVDTLIHQWFMIARYCIAMHLSTNIH